MNLINIENLTKVYTERKLFDNTSFSLQDGEKVGVIGINGTGKTTLLRMIMGEEETDEGTITTANHVVMRYLPQHPEFEPEKSSLECVLEGNVTEENRWSVESDAKAMMTRLGIKDFMQPAGQLSGGQRKRLALISVLLSPADILLLDEPTNHLDNDMADWLEDYLKKWRGALIMVTHDRYFLDSVCNRIVEIDKGKIYSYQTNYSGYLELKTQRQEMEASSERKRQSILRVELEWIRRGARARSTKQKAHIQRYEELRDRQAPVQDSQVELSSISTRMGKTTVELENICKAYGERKLIDDFSYIFLKGDRVGFIGPNGCGKSTLMKIIAGIIPQDSGQVIIGQTVKMGYYAQEIASEKSEDAQEIDLSYMDPAQRVIDYVKDTAEYIRTVDGVISATVLLERFLFPPEKQYSPIGKLSGGEKKRLNLLRVLATSPNFILLDEPTNNLDIATLTILEDYLDHYEGIVVTVSHDRYFLDKVTNKILEISHGNLYAYEANYSKFLELKAEREEMELASERKRQSVLRMELEWAKRGCRARSTKQRARLERLEALKNGKAPVRDANVELDSVETRMGKKTIELHHISKSFGEKKILDDFNYIVLRNQRLGIIGPNGCGKSTLIKIIDGMIQPDAGEVEIGETIRIGYFAQEVPDMDTNQRVIDYIRDVAEYIPTRDGKISATMMLERFLFDSAMQYAPIAKLSGGEKRRLYLLKVLMEAPNVLLLDEPSNDLDIPTLTILEDYLDSFAGIVIAVSHDRYFLDNIVDRIFAFEGNGHLTQYEGGYTDYTEALARKGGAVSEGQSTAVGAEKKKSAQADWKQNRPQKLKFTYKEQREFETIDDDIAALEELLEKLDKNMEANATNSVKLREIMEQKEKAQADLDEKMDRWVYLNDLAERIEAQKSEK